jgi:hypothetical protein
MFDALSIPVALTFVGVLVIGALLEKWIDATAARRAGGRRSSRVSKPRHSQEP